MYATFGEFVHIVTNGVSFGEQNLCEVLRLDNVSRVNSARYRLNLVQTFVSDDKSSHCTALLMFAKAKTPWGLRSVNRR